MPGPQKILRATDKEIVEAFAAMSKDLDVQKASLSFAIYADGHPATFTCELSNIGDDENINRILNQNSVLFQDLSIVFTPLNHLSVRVQRAEPFDLLHFHVRQNQPTPEVQAQAIAVMDKHLYSFKPTPIPDSAIGEELSNFYRSRDEVVAKLERLNAQIIKQNDEYRKKLETEFDHKRTKLEKDFDDRKEHLEKKISDEKEVLQEERKALDDRSARQARRDQFRDLKTVLQSRNTDFALTEGTVKKRFVLHALFAVLVGTLGVIVGLLVYKQIVLNEPDQYFGLRLPAAIIGFVLSLVYYIRWNDDWFGRHADEEFKLKRYDLDMDRAGWLVELVIEAYEAGEEPIPNELLRRLSNNMFIGKEGDGASRKISQHPSADIRDALLDAAGEVEIDVPGIGKVVLTRKQIRRLQRDIGKGRIAVSEATD